MNHAQNSADDSKSDMDKKIDSFNQVMRNHTDDLNSLKNKDLDRIRTDAGSGTDSVPSGAPMVRVPGGNYGGTARSSPRIELKPFGICRYEVTWGHFQEVRKWAAQKGYTDLANVGSGRGPMHPVSHVNWYDAVKWCNALSEIAGKEPAYTVDGKVYRVGESDKVSVQRGAGYRLPTEDEWCAAFGGGLPKENTIFSGSNVDTDVAWFKDNSGGGTQPVGQKKPNKLGIHDMSGNVQEWTEEQDVTYVTVVPIANIQRHARGGGWFSSGGEWVGYPYTRKGELTASDPETARMPKTRSEQIGFRYVITEK